MAALTSRRLPLATGLTYHLLEWEGPGDHTLLVLHGFLDFAWSFVPLIEAGLAGRTHVVAPDLRGHGDSDRVGAGGYYHFADYLPDVHDLVNQVARRRLSIVGHSMGGSVASYYAGTFPDRVEKLILLEGIGPPETPSPTGPERMAAWIRGWERVRSLGPRPYPSLEATAERLRQHDPHLGQELALELAARGTRVDADGMRFFKHDPLHLTLGPYGGFQREVASRFWRQVTCPVLHVRGSDSEMLTEEDREHRLACFRTVTRATLDGAGHMMQRHRPAALARLINDFLSPD